jgi:hypothetical protein
LKVDARRADGAGRSHFGDIGDLTEVAFERGRYRRGDHLRGSAGQLGPHRNGRKIHLGQGRDRQFEEGKRAGCRDPEGQQDGRDGPSDEGVDRLMAVRPRLK